MAPFDNYITVEPLAVMLHACVHLCVQTMQGATHRKTNITRMYKQQLHWRLTKGHWVFCIGFQVIAEYNL